MELRANEPIQQATLSESFTKWLNSRGNKIKLIILFILITYLVLGVTVLGFNRSPMQILITTLSCAIIEVFLGYVFKKKFFFPLAGIITSCSLSLLLNYSHDYYILLIPVFFAIGSKYIFTFNSKHIYNPAQIAVTLSLLFFGDVITSSPAYQWNGIASMSIFMGMLGVFIILPGVKRTPLVLSFLTVFTAQTFLRGMIMKHHLPFETLFLGTLTSPAFLLFTFFMITDPATSPADKKGQIKVGATIAILDLIFHIGQSYYTFFYAAFTLQTYKLIKVHYKSSKDYGLKKYFTKFFIESKYYYRPLLLAIIWIIAALIYKNIIFERVVIKNITFKMTEISKDYSGINPQMGDTLTRVDERIHHIAKWVLSVGDAVGSGDINNDGLVDLFFTAPLKSDHDRNSLFINEGNFKFRRVIIPALEQRTIEIEKYGLPSNAIFIDFDNDGDQDLFITYAFGTPLLLENQLVEKGKVEFNDITNKSGLGNYTNSISAIFFDINNDGQLDLIIGNVWPKNLPNYDQPTQLNLFKLPEKEFPKDERMFNFMHSSWHQSDNGGLNDIYLQKNKKFIKQDSKKWGLNGTYWSLALGASDFNNDGFTDLYIANDFGPDEFYLNQSGKYFKSIKGKIFGEIGLDTYKGMNVTLGDFDGNLKQDIHISNVHHAMQAEGSMLWMNMGNDEFGTPKFKDRATELGILNENRFGWGASAADFNNDGLLDMAQANGMVDDTVDKIKESCPDYWYVNEKIARSAPHIHTMANKWGDIRGYCIFGKEKNRLYINKGTKKGTRFVDVAGLIGMDKETNSRGVSATDLNNDGSMDLVITHQFQGPTIYRNQPLQKKNWISFKLQGNGTTCNRDAINTRVTVSSGDKVLMREVFSVNGFSSQSDRRLHFGLGDTTSPISVAVKWCNGESETFAVTQLNKYYKIIQNGKISIAKL
ncbi:FG-GAP-like repeat-containing protein [Halobacteriovorax sp. HLS]|uniref:FG-GAP-like repeat-containing protein n=1 Tax=Halobacteriovorax sp. HLS TaxID=2234000 RepID=UPI000FDBC88E|nr:FG-GAP-like repeat-containing protein [Halobacteriovorax sp. HLS]